jgi:hypothetical protein
MHTARTAHTQRLCVYDSQRVEKALGTAVGIRAQERAFTTRPKRENRKEAPPHRGSVFSSSPATTPDVLSSAFGIDLGFNTLYELAVAMGARIALLRLR